MGHSLPTEGRSSQKISRELGALENKEMCTVSVQRMDKEITSLNYVYMLDLNIILS